MFFSKDLKEAKGVTWRTLKFQREEGKRTRLGVESSFSFPLALDEAVRRAQKLLKRVSWAGWHVRGQRIGDLCSNLAWSLTHATHIGGIEARLLHQTEAKAKGN